MNKRGVTISLEFLAGLIISLLIFVPLYMKVSDYFRTTSQAQKDFENLNKIIGEVSMAQTGTILSAPLLLDSATGIFYFEKGNNISYEYKVVEKGFGIITTKIIKVMVTNPISTEKAALCLCRTISLSKEVNKAQIGKCEKYICHDYEDLEVVFLFSDKNPELIGKPPLKNSNTNFDSVVGTQDAFLKRSSVYVLKYDENTVVVSDVIIELKKLNEIISQKTAEMLIGSSPIGKTAPKSI